MMQVLINSVPYLRGQSQALSSKTKREDDGLAGKCGQGLLQHKGLTRTPIGGIQVNPQGAKLVSNAPIKESVAMGKS
jgi:hypothetical protein